MNQYIAVEQCGRKASSKGTLGRIDQIEAEQWKSSLCLNCLSFSCTLIYVDIYIYILSWDKYIPYHTYMRARTHTYKTYHAPSPWRPSLDKRKTALSRAAVQLFSVVKHVSVWQSKLLFRFAVPDTDWAFKIWGEASHHCSQCCKRYRQLFTHTLCACVYRWLYACLCVVYSRAESSILLYIVVCGNQFCPLLHFSEIWLDW